MQRLQRHQSEPGATRWPLWVLFAIAPVVIALGAVAGMAMGTYATPTPGPVATTPQSTTGAPEGSAAVNQPQPPAESAAKDPAQSAATAPPAAEVTPSAVSAQPVQPDDLPDSNRGPLVPGAVLPASTPSIPAPREIKDVRDARALLSDAFSTLPSETGAISSIDYQVMRNQGLSSSLVGMVSVGAYPAWVAALEQHPDHLQSLLEDAIHQIQPAVVHDRFFVAWAVVDVLPSRPPGFLDQEVTPLANGSFMIIRPLAASMDLAGGKVALRSADSLRQAVAGAGVPGAGSPWATYGPVVRFDNNDLYRPTGATKPRQ